MIDLPVNDNRRKRQRSEKQDGELKSQPGSAYCIALRQLDSFVNDHSRVGELHLSAMSRPQLLRGRDGLTTPDATTDRSI